VAGLHTTLPRPVGAPVPVPVLRCTSTDTTTLPGLCTSVGLADGEKRPFLALRSANDCSRGRELSAHAHLSKSTKHSSGISGVDASDTTSSLMATRITLHDLSRRLAKQNKPHKTTNCTHHSFDKFLKLQEVICPVHRCRRCAGVGDGAVHRCTVVCNPVL
jgi:hypothetical protein